MTRHTFSFGRPAFKYTIMVDGRGTTWLTQVAEKWHNELADRCKGLLAADWGSSWRKNTPGDITHKMVGNIWFQLRRDLSKKWAKLLVLKNM